MKKIGYLIMIYSAVIVVYLMMMALQGFTNDIVTTVNASATWTNYPETQAVLIGWPFWAYLIPAALGLIATVNVLRGE